MWALAGLLVALAGAMASPVGAAPAACPRVVVTRIEALYRWQVARQDERGPMDLSSQRSRFTPDLYRRLQAAYRLDPATGRFIDFDVFSGTQVGTLGARVVGCTRAERGALDAQVSVQAGMRNRPLEAPQQLVFRMRPGPGGDWRIADIRYPGEPGFRLSQVLAELLDPPPTGGSQPAGPPPR